VHWWFRIVYRLRIEGSARVPDEGPLLFVSNHQSYFDPLLVGLSVRSRQLRYLARSGLFRFKPFAWLIRSLGALPVRQGGGDAAAMKASISILREGGCLVVFPEGTRTMGGVMEPFKRGVLLLIRRARVPVVPVAVDGARDAWPPDRKHPSLRGHVAVSIGHPVDPDTLLAMDPEEALEHLRREVETLRLELRQTLRARTRNRWPERGPGDLPYWEQSSPSTPDADAAGAGSLQPQENPG
jgi:1-acyl-sn-glycerol-3-phosphate acyltransferase